MMNFQSSFNDLTIQALRSQAADSFYAVRGVEVESLEITRYECADKRTALVLQQIIQETTNRINHLQVQETSSAVQAASLAGEISLERQRTDLMQSRAENIILEAAADGDAEGLQKAAAAETFIGGLKSSVPSVEQRLDLYKLHLRLKSKNRDIKNLASSNAKLFLTPEDAGLRS